MALTIQGITSGNGVEADATNHMLVNTPTLATSAGYIRAVSEIDPGSYIGTPTIRTGKVTMGRAQLVSSDTPFIYENFNYAAQNTADYKYLTTTLTTTFGGGYATLNGGSSTAAGETLLQTYRSVPIFSTGAMSCSFNVYLTQQPGTNFQCEYGLFLQSGTAPYTPTDGVYFRFTSAGLIGVVNYNGTETTTGVMVAVGASFFTNPTTYQIILNANKVEFWSLGTSTTIAPTLLGLLYTSSAQPFLSGALPVAIRQLQTGTVSVATQLKLAWFSAQIHDMEANKPWEHVMAGDGAHAYQGQNGGTMGGTAAWTNSTNPIVAVPTNTAAALGSGLGGQFWSTQTLAVNTDGIISSFQVPAGSTTQQPRGMYITGIRIDSIVQTVLAGGPFILQWGLAFGHTAVSLATLEAAATKKPRVITLGFQFFAATAAVGVQATPIVMSWTTPIYINPGEFLQTIYKNIGTVGTGGTLAHSITFDGYWE